MAAKKRERVVAAWVAVVVWIAVGDVSCISEQTLKVTRLPEAPSLSVEGDPILLSNEVEDGSVSLRLQHVDALKEKTTPHRLFHARLQRDASRVASIHGAAKRGSFNSSVVSGMAQGSGEYFTRIGVGTPPRYAYMVLDTGSDVVWLQCAPCRSCYSQKDPVFNPAASSTFSGIPCQSRLCRSLDSAGCDSRRKVCLYEVSYGDGSFTFGDFSTETLTFRGTRVPAVALGCGHDNEGLFVGAAGLLGLGRGSLSFPAQTGSRFNKKFSYCLSDRSLSSLPSSLIFGDASVSRVARFTPLMRNTVLDTFYYVQLVGFSVGGAAVSGITPSLFKLDQMGDGGVIIDSGTSVTRLTRPAYVALRNAFLAAARHLKRAPDYSLFDCCFDLSGLTEVKVPTLVLHFKGADVSLPAANYLIPVDNKTSFCFAFAATASGLSIIGNIQQQGIRVIFDLAKSLVGFATGSCS